MIYNDVDMTFEVNNISKKLEARIARLERAMSLKNERLSRDES